VAAVPNTVTVNGHALSSNVVVSASDITTGTLPHAQLPALVSADIPANASNTTGTASNLSGTPALPNGTTATTQTAGDATTKLATDAFVSTAVSAEATARANADSLLLSITTAASTYAPLSGTASGLTAGNATNWGSYGGVPAAGTSGGTANSIIRSDANGYTYFYYINSTCPNSENAAVGQVITTNGSDNYFRKSSIGSFTTYLSGTAASLTAGAANTLHSTAGNGTYNWSGQGGQPSWLWGSNDGTNFYVWNPSNFSVNYANSAGTATTCNSWNAASSIATNGYQKLSNGLIIQWGFCNGTSTASQLVYFPVAFPTACCSVQNTLYTGALQSRSGGDNNDTVCSVSLSYFYLRTDGIPTQGGYWLAIGY
jgi:hypothetical protein